MNYSYIKTVFPTFENTVDYEKNTFNKLKSMSSTSSTMSSNVSNVTGISNDIGVPVKSDNTEKFYSTQEKLLDIPNEYKLTLPQSLTQVKEGVNNKEHFDGLNDAAIYTKNVLPSKQISNLQYYNLPSNKEYLQHDYSSQKLGYTSTPIPRSYIETFNDSNTTNQMIEQVPSVTHPVLPQLTQTTKPITQSLSGCTSNYNHIMDCSSCKEMIYKTLNINKKNSYTEEVFELISYCIFAIFILLLLDKITK